MVDREIVTSIALLAFLAWIYLKPVFDFALDTNRYGRFHSRIRSGFPTAIFTLLLGIVLGAQVFSAWYVVHRDLIEATTLSAGFFYAIIALAFAGVATGNYIWFNAIHMMGFPERVVPGRFENQAMAATLWAVGSGIAIAVLVGLTFVGVAFWFGVVGVVGYLILTLWYRRYVRKCRLCNPVVQKWARKMRAPHHH